MDQSFHVVERGKFPGIYTKYQDKRKPCASDQFTTTFICHSVNSLSLFESLISSLPFNGFMVLHESRNKYVLYIPERDISVTMGVSADFPIAELVSAAKSILETYGNNFGPRRMVKLIVPDSIRPFIPERMRLGLSYYSKSYDLFDSVSKYTVAGGNKEPVSSNIYLPPIESEPLETTKREQFMELKGRTVADRDDVATFYDKDNDQHEKFFCLKIHRSDNVARFGLWLCTDTATPTSYNPVFSGTWMVPPNTSINKANFSILYAIVNVINMSPELHDAVIFISSRYTVNSLTTSLLENFIDCHGLVTRLSGQGRGGKSLVRPTAHGTIIRAIYEKCYSSGTKLAQSNMAPKLQQYMDKIVDPWPNIADLTYDYVYSEYVSAHPHNKALDGTLFILSL